MRGALISVLLVAALPVGAGVYRWVDDTGRTHYSDRPVAGAQAVPVPASKVPESAAATPESDVAGDPGPYTAFEILSPEPNATLRDADARVPISLLIDPPLSAGHRVQIVLNGEVVPGDTPGMHLSLQGLPFGTHRLRAEIVDNFGVPLASTPTVDFHLRRPVPEP